MIAVEVISKNGGFDLQNAVNDWLRTNSHLDIIDVKFTGSGTGYDAKYCAMIIYKVK